MESPRSRSRRGLSHVVVALVVLSACTGSRTTAEPTPAPVADPLLETARSEGSVDVIVQLAVPQSPDGSWDEAAVGHAQHELLGELGPRALPLERFDKKLPQIMLRLKPAGLRKLRQSPLVVSITLNTTDEPTE